MFINLLSSKIHELLLQSASQVEEGHKRVKNENILGVNVSYKPNYMEKFNLKLPLWRIYA